jgi:hypothetical protein
MAGCEITEKSNYIDQLADTVRHIAGDEYNDYAGIDLYRNYALLVLVRGTATTMRDVHDAWSAWAAGFRADSANIIPFDQLTPDYQEQDRVYVDAIHAVARMFCLEEVR